MKRSFRHAVCVLAGTALAVAAPVAAAGSVALAQTAAAVSVSGQLHAVAAVSAGDVWAVGCSGSCNGPDSLIMHWNGAAWSTVTSPDPGAGFDTLTGVTAVSANDVWAVGYSCAVATCGVYDTLILHWNGVAWSAVTSPDPSATNNELNAVSAASAGDVWAAGTQSAATGVQETLLLHWNGTQWSAVNGPGVSGNANQLYAVSADTAADVWTAGDECASGGCPVPLIPTDTLTGHWNGTQWSVVASPSPGSYFNGLFGVTALSAGNAWAVGNTSSTGSAPQSLVEHWNGSAWTQVASANPGPGADELDAVSAATAGNIWAVGDQLGSGGLPYTTLTEHWNGTAWSAVASPAGSGTFSNDLNGVAAVSARSAFAVGWSENSGAAAQVLILRWNGKAWSVQ